MSTGTARPYKRLFVPVAAAPNRQGCFNLDAGLSYGSSGTVALDFSAASELLLIAPRDLDADYAKIDHRVTASLHIARDCAGTAAPLRSQAVRPRPQGALGHAPLRGWRL
jgi:hypothetical protein